MKPTNVTGYPFSNGDRLTAISVNQICNALDAIQDYNDTIKEFEDLVEENTEEIKSEINNAVTKPDSVLAVTSEMTEAKKEIAAAINAKGGTADPLESFQQLAQDITYMSTTLITSGVVVSEKMNWLKFICSSEVINRLPLEAIDDNTVEEISQGTVCQNCTALQSVTMNALTVISGGSVFLNCTALQSVTMNALTVISGGSVFNNCISLQDITLPSLKGMTGGGNGSGIFKNCTSLRRAYFPSVTIWSGSQGFDGCSNLQSVEFGTLTSLTDPFQNNKPNLRNITIGQDTDVNLPFNQWTATYVVAEGATGIAELNDNLYNNLLTKLYDHSNDGETRTLRIGWLANVSAENIAYANAKGWTLTT